MKMHLLDMHILKKLQDNTFLIEISEPPYTASLSFSTENKQLIFLENNKLTTFLLDNEYQLRKILHNKKPNTFYPGFRLQFALRSGKDVAAFNDRSKIVILDKRNDKCDSYTSDLGENKIVKIYTDGSYIAKHEQGAYAFLIENLLGEYRLFTGRTDLHNSNLIELLAAIKALEILQQEDKLRFVTDSQYVRKGLTEWIINWKLNDWKTVNGEDVKHIDYWQLFDSLTENKYIEFSWVKAHSNHFENSICDFYAKEAAAAKE